MYSKTKSKVITVNANIINRKEVPERFFLPKSCKKEWEQIFHFKFSNGFEYYYGTNKTFVDGLNLLTFLKVESGLVNLAKDYRELKKLFIQEYSSNVSYKNCKKIFNWYKLNINKVNDIIQQFVK